MFLVTNENMGLCLCMNEIPVYWEKNLIYNFSYFYLSLLCDSDLNNKFSILVSSSSYLGMLSQIDFFCQNLNLLLLHTDVATKEITLTQNICVIMHIMQYQISQKEFNTCHVCDTTINIRDKQLQTRLYTKLMRILRNYTRTA